MNHSLMLAAIIKPQAHESFLVQQFFKNAAEVWASSPHLRSKLYLQLVFPAAIAFFETYQLTIWFFLWNKLQIRTRQRGNCSTLAGKSRGGTPFCRTLKIGFSKSIVSRETIYEDKMFFWDWLQLSSRRQIKVFWSNNFSKMLARFRASSPDRCPQAAKSPCHPSGTRRGWWEKRQLFEVGRTRPPRLVKPKQETDIL